MDTIKTKNFWWFAAGLGVLGSAFLLRSPYMAFALYAFLLLLLLANATSRLWLSGLDCSRVLSASVLRQGEPLEVEVTAAGESTTLAEIARLMEAASGSKSRYVRLADRAARRRAA